MDGGEVEMAEVKWDPKKEEREIMFLYDIFANEAGWRGRRSRDVSMPAIDIAAKKLDEFILDVIDERREQRILLGKLREMNLGTSDARSDAPSKIKHLMKCIFDHCNLSSSAFEWISADNQRQCDFIWACLRISHEHGGRLVHEQSLIIHEGPEEFDEKDRSRLPVIDLLGFNSNLYEKLGLPTLVEGGSGKRYCIIRFFDLWDVSREDKENQMERFKRAWDKIKNKSAMADWLNKNDSMAGWAWTYTLKRFLSFDTPVWVDLSNSKGDEKEKHALITLYDMLCVKDQALLMASLRKSGAVQKHRVNSNNRKPMSIPLSDEHKDMLKQIARDSNCKIYQVVEEMIEQAYQQHCSS
ncbi:hypothetical protein [Aeromonas salmonicida]|uniref:Uncharacterized protein n=1 Tax=Aeromonas salmonicida TaxID=645 RepID=A0AAX3VTK2_AERSA|nr:hypothetical protein [Aeromonas salmonicida]WHF36144.1 hypothetical protein QLQ87_18760 [Aeromonas salmonicida]